MNGNKQPRKKPVYPNNWQEYKDQPDEFFIPHTFEDLMDWRVESWELPSSVSYLFRMQNRLTGKITEKAYQKEAAAIKRLKKLINDNTHDITVCNATAMHHISEFNIYAEDGIDGL